MKFNDAMSILHGLLAERSVIYFQPCELLEMGSAHRTLKAPNSLPPEKLLVNLADVAAKADLVRGACGFPLIVISAYRSPAYNAAVGGAKNSCHLEGKALDLKPVATSRFPDLADAADLMWDAKAINGGLGQYETFIHLDTGRRRRW